MSLGKKILIGLAVGLAIGFCCPGAVGYLRPLGDIFLRLLKMLMVPLVFFTITAGVCKMGDVKRLRTVGLSFVLYILVTSGLCSLIGIGVGILTGIGKGTTEFLSETTEEVAATSFSFVDTAVSWVPENVFEAAVRADMVQIIVFAIFLGVALLALGPRARNLTAIIDEASEVMLKITAFVMEFSPIGIGALMASMVVTIGGATAREVLGFVALDNISCFVILIVLYPLIIRFLTRFELLRFCRAVVDPAIVAITTTSSAATLPVSIKTAREKLELPEDVYGFTLPLGNTCGMNGAALYFGLVCVFAYHLYGRPLTFGAILEFMFLGIVLSVGGAGVKGSGIVLTSVLLQTLGLPLGVMPIIAAIWPTLDPMHTVLNNVSDLTGTTLIASRLNERASSYKEN